MKNIPEIGKVYKFYDDGKVSASRMYPAVVNRIIIPEKAKTIKFPIYVYEESDWLPTTVEAKGTEIIGEKSLYDIWKDNIDEDPFLFSSNTDYFVECSIPLYDKYPIWFVRTKKETWFSMDIQSHWQGGILDVSGELTKQLEYYIFNHII